MDIGELQRLTPYQHLDRSTLAGVARHCREVIIPAARWLLRPGGRLHGACYLLTGTAELAAPAERVVGGTERARRPIYPGPRAIRVAGRARILRVDTAAVGALLEPRPAPLAPCRTLEQGWMARFLARPALRSLSPLHWQQLLRAMSPLALADGQWLLHEGDAAGVCFVVRSGRIELSRRGRVLAVAAAGDLFGEDALATGGLRNASARALGDAAVMALPAAVFQSWLLEAVTRWQEPPPSVVRLSEALAPERLHFWRLAGAQDPAPVVAASCAPQALREEPPRLLSGLTYLVTGASAGQRALAALLLARPGLCLRLAADQARTVRSAAQARSA